MTTLLVVMPSTLKKLTGHIGFGLSVCACVHLSVSLSRTVHARVLKFHVWIPHGKMAEHVFFFPSYLPSWSYALLKKSE